MQEWAPLLRDPSPGGGEWPVLPPQDPHDRAGAVMALASRRSPVAPKGDPSTL